MLNDVEEEAKLESVAKCDISLESLHCHKTHVQPPINSFGCSLEMIEF